MTLDWRPVTVMPCACGSYLEADVRKYRDVRQAVECHRRTYIHRLWAWQQGYYDDAVRPD